jgi:ABC-type multidrug transport system fused ATPase/permease subunit
MIESPGVWWRFHEDDVTRQQVRPGTARRVWPYLRRYRGPMVLLVLITSVDSAIAVTIPLILRLIIDDGILRHRESVIVTLALAVAGLALVAAGAQQVGARYSDWIGESLVLELRTSVFRHVLRQPLAFFTRTQTGSLVSRMEDVNVEHPAADRVSLASLEPAAPELAALEPAVLAAPERPGDAWVLRDVTFQMPAGKLTALVGPSGAGKTTITHLVLRLYDPLISSLPDGLDTIAGDRGYRFSGGEKQRLALARLLLKAPSVVVLDEATAHLDSESELAIQRALATALAGRTSLVIAHRLSTVRAADQILVVDSGQIAERGTHDELLAVGGVYAGLYQTQFASQAALRPILVTVPHSLARCRPGPSRPAARECRTGSLRSGPRAG